MNESKTRRLTGGTSKTLLVGIGNNCRGDDGLGWKFVEKIEQLRLDFVDCEFRYQLQVEDAALVQQFDVVIFADASHVKLDKGFELKRCEASEEVFFSTHAQSPEAILQISRDLYYKSPVAYTIAMSGKDWQLKESLSDQAEHNLQAALAFFVRDFLPAVQPQAVNI